MACLHLRTVQNRDGHRCFDCSVPIEQVRRDWDAAKVVPLAPEITESDLEAIGAGGIK